MHARASSCGAGGGSGLLPMAADGFLFVYKWDGVFASTGWQGALRGAGEVLYYAGLCEASLGDVIRARTGASSQA